MYGPLIKVWTMVEKESYVADPRITKGIKKSSKRKQKLFKKSSKNRNERK